MHRPGPWGSGARVFRSRGRRGDRPGEKGECPMKKQIKLLPEPAPSPRLWPTEAAQLESAIKEDGRRLMETFMLSECALAMDDKWRCYLYVLKFPSSFHHQTETGPDVWEF